MDTGLTASEAGRAGCAPCYPSGTFSLFGLSCCYRIKKSWFLLFPLSTIVLYLPPLWMLPWPNGHKRTSSPTSESIAAFWQKNWDEISAAASASAILESADSEVSHARLLATMTKESGAWLHALPITSLGLRMDDTTLRIAVGLRLGTAICGAHLCHHCGAGVDCLGTHGLSCQHSEGRLHRHAYINDIIH